MESNKFNATVSLKMEQCSKIKSRNIKWYVKFTAQT